MFGRRRRIVHIVEMIPNEVWEALTGDEKDVLFAVDDRLTGQKSQAQYVERLVKLREASQRRRKLGWEVSL